MTKKTMSVTHERSPGSTTASSSEDDDRNNNTRRVGSVIRRRSPQQQEGHGGNDNNNNDEDENAFDSDDMDGTYDETCIHPLSPPFELTTRGFSTEWMVDDGRHKGDKLYPLLLTYISCILLGQLCLMLILPFGLSWTVTNVVHGFVTMLYLHWMKGSPDFLEPGGETNGMTLWEQLAATSSSSPVVSPHRHHHHDVSQRDSSSSGGGGGTSTLSPSNTTENHDENDDNTTPPRSTSPSTTSKPTAVLHNNEEHFARFANQRLVLLVVPTLLCHAACHFSSYDKRCCLVNVSVWTACVVAKMPFMYGVRLLGINRTAGIDDDLKRRRRRNKK